MSEQNRDAVFEGEFLGGLTGRPAGPEEAAPEEEAAPPEGEAAPGEGQTALERLAAARDAASARAAQLEEELAVWRQGGRPPEEERSALERGWLAFLEAHPEVRDPMTELPDAVWRAIGEGKTPCAAYLEHENSRLRERVGQLTEALAAAERGRLAREKSPGSARSFGPSRGGPDPFVEGLLRGF